MMTSPLPSSSSELSLQCKPPSQSQTILVMKPLTDHNHHTPDQITFQKLEDYIHRLEEEHLKIDAFKRELPLCMHLLTHEMETSRQQLQSYNKENQGAKPVLEQFMPLQVSSNSAESDQKSANMSEKANWMTSAQLWSQSSDGNYQQSTTLPKAKTDVGHNNLSPKQDFDTKQRNGGAFLPFRNDQNSSHNNSSTTLLPVPDLALASSDMELTGKKLEKENENGNNGSRNENMNIGGNGVTKKGADTTTTTTQAQRKARRCWSPELHRRFVNALQMLGGSQVATPKQIRELMKVDGLTNDEVKSHLQKYRLHTRRPGPAAGGSPAPQLVVLGGIWVPPEYTTGTSAVHGGLPTMYGPTHPTSQVSPYYGSPTMPQEFYPAPPLLPPPQAHTQLHHQTLHHQVHVYNTSSHTQVHSFPESDAREIGGRSESIEDGKSENSSWKSSGENDRDDKKLAPLPDDGGESNGCEIILTF